MTTTPEGWRLLSNSEIATFKRCRRKWYLGYFRGLQPRSEESTGARALGNSLHFVLGNYYDPADPVATVDDVLAQWDGLYAASIKEAEDANESGRVKDLHKDRDLGRAILEGYFEWIAEEGRDSDWEVIGSEREVFVPLTGYQGPRPVMLTAKLDVAIQRRSDGAKAFVDHKSVQTINDLKARADIDEQFFHYALLSYLEHLANPEATFVDGGIFNLLRKVKRTARAKPPFFERVDVRKTVGELRLYWLRVAGEALEIQRAEDRLNAGEPHHYVAYPTPTRDCSWDCDFRVPCPMMDDPSQDAEGLLAAVFETGDPYARYETKGEDA